MNFQVTKGALDWSWHGRAIISEIYPSIWMSQAWVEMRHNRA